MSLGAGSYSNNFAGQCNNYLDYTVRKGRYKEVMIVAKRHEGAKYVQDESSLSDRLRGLLEKTSWEELGKSDLYHFLECDPTSCR